MRTQFQSDVLRSRIAVVLASVLVTVGACSKAPASPTSPTTATPPPSPPAPPTVPTPPPPGPAVHSTLNAPGATVNPDGVWTERTVAGADRETYDDFVLSSATTIRHIEWQGMRGPSRPPQQFYLSFIADTNMGPVRQRDASDSALRPVPLWFEIFPLANVNERLDASRPCEQVPTQTCAWYDYAVTLANPFTAAAGTRYWIMIQAEPAPPYRDSTFWLWRKGTRDNGFARTSLANTTFTWDLAFALRP